MHLHLACLAGSYRLPNICSRKKNLFLFPPSCAQFYILATVYGFGHNNKLGASCRAECFGAHDGCWPLADHCFAVTGVDCCNFVPGGWLSAKLNGAGMVKPALRSDHAAAIRVEGHSV